MSHSKEQETVVMRVLSYKPHQYYEILSCEKSSSDADIKKSYRKLAIKLHPDKNPHPRSSEAFKYLNKAWGVLGDPEKKRIFDQTGLDPESRSQGFSSGAGFPRGGASGGFGGASPFEDDIFNLFFGGGRPMGGGPAFTFGNNGFTFQSFGGQPPFGGNQFRPRQQQRTRNQQPQQEPSLLDSLRQLVPLLLLFVVPLISSLFSDLSTPDYSFHKTRQFSVERTTPRYKIPFFVTPELQNKKDMTAKKLQNFDDRVENLYVQDKRSKCSREQILKNEMIEDAQGWFFTDEAKMERAQNMAMPNCQFLRNLNLI